MPPASAPVDRGVVIGSSNTLRSRFPVDAGALKLQGNTAALGRVKKGRMTSCNIRAYNQSGDTVVARVEGLPRYIKAYVRPGVCLQGRWPMCISVSIRLTARIAGG